MPTMIIIPPTRVNIEGNSLKIIIAIMLAKIGSLNVEIDINVDDTYLTM